jgi:hypothetical protein
MLTLVERVRVIVYISLANKGWGYCLKLTLLIRVRVIV